MVSPEAFVQDQIPTSKWSAIPTILRIAYAAAGDMVRDNPILQIESALDNNGRFISYAVDFSFRRAIESGMIDCDFRWRDFARPTGRYLELRFSHSTASISQVAVATKPPREVIFRENARLRNQGFLPYQEFAEELTVSGLPHLLIVHGHQILNFAHIAVPSSEFRSEYVWRSLNLMNLPHEVSSDNPPPEDTDYDLEELALLKEDIDQWRRDNDKSRQ